jgi:hypothetical protein
MAADKGCQDTRAGAELEDAGVAEVEQRWRRRSREVVLLQEMPSKVEAAEVSSGGAVKPDECWRTSLAICSSPCLPCEYAERRDPERW